MSAAGLILGVPIALAGALVFLALGQVVAAVAPSNGVAVILGQMLLFGLMFTSDLVFPLEMMPRWVQQGAPYLPTYPVVQLVRSAFTKGGLGPNLPFHLGLMAAYAVVATAAAARLFRWDPRT